MIKINGYPLDLALTENCKFPSQSTKFPAESGSKFSDNIQNDPVEIELEGIVSRTPIGAVALDPTRKVEAGSPLADKDAYDRLLDIRAAREPVSIEISLGKFDMMAMGDLTVPRDKGTGLAFHFTVMFSQLTIVQNARTTLRVAVPNCNGKMNGGNRQPLVGLNGKPVPDAFESVPRYVTSFAKKSRASLKATLGDPILSTTAVERIFSGSRKDTFNGVDMDHYPIGKGNVADGYVKRGADHKDAYYAMSVAVDKYGRTSGVGGSTTTIYQKIGDEPVHYDYADSTWKSDKDNHVVKQVPKGQDRWEGVKWGRNPNTTSGG